MIEIQNEKFKLVLFVLYTILYESLVWGLTAAAIYYLQWSAWTVVVGMIMSGSQFKPWHFGLHYKNPNPEKTEEQK